MAQIQINPSDIQIVVLFRSISGSKSIVKRYDYETTNPTTVWRAIDRLDNKYGSCAHSSLYFNKTSGEYYSAYSPDMTTQLTIVNPFN